MSGSVAGLLAFIIEIHSSQVATSGLDSMRVVSEQIERIPENKEGALHVLVVDDKSENLNLALKLLSKDHYLTLASGYAEGKKLIEKNNYDVVLCDCQMPADFDSSLSVDALEIGQTVHNGLFLMFPATQSGARFAIVTDANHHQDWVSAIFDDLREPQVINGQPVLFINYMGKKWDEALEKLMNL